MNPENPARLSSDEEEGVDEVSEKKNNIDFEGVSADLLPLSYFRFGDGKFKASVWSCILNKDTGKVGFNPHSKTLTWLLLCILLADILLALFTRMGSV